MKLAGTLIVITMLGLSVVLGQSEKPTATRNIPMTDPQYVLAFHEQHYGHSVSFVGLPGGRILEGGGSEFRISSDGGLTWSAPFTGRDEKGQPVQERSLVKLSGKGIGLCYSSYSPEVADFRSKTAPEEYLLFRRSDDEGHTWSASIRITPANTSAFMWNDNFLRTSSGRIILPAYRVMGQNGDLEFHLEGAPFVGGLLNGVFVSTDAHFYDPHFSASFVFYSDDDGATWKRNRDGELFIIIEPIGQIELTLEPSVTELSPGNLLMMMRTRVGRYYQAWSNDNGETWTRPQPTQLAGTQAPAQIRTLPGSGHLIVVFTQQSDDEVRKGFIRTRLSSAISRNGGGVWEHFQNIESILEETHVEPGPIHIVRPGAGYSMRKMGAFENDPLQVVSLPADYGRWSYPSVFVLKDRVLVSYPYSRDAESGSVGMNRLKVLPVRWFYGGREPSENSLFKKIGEPPKP